MKYLEKELSRNASLEKKEEEFKKTDFYKNGFILLNRKVVNSLATLLEYQEPDIIKHHTYALRTYRSAVNTIFDDTGIRANRVAANYMNTHRFSVWDKTIILKGLNKIPFYRFDNLQKYFPSIKS